MRRRNSVDKPDPPPRFEIFGLRVERKTDLIAATAFILDFVGAVTQLVSFLRVSDVNFYRPDYLLLFFDPYPNGDVILRIAATMSYVNSGEAPYGAIIRRERVLFNLHNRTYEQVWQSFQRIDRSGVNIKFEKQGDAQPTPIPGASSVSHPTIFAPKRIICKPEYKNCDPYQNYVTRRDFLKSLEPNMTISVALVAEIVGYSKLLTEKCQIDIDPGVAALLAMNQWYSAPCVNAQ